MSDLFGEHLDRLVGKLGLDQKVRLLTGAAHSRLHAEPAVGLGAMTMSDGPAGVRGPGWNDGSPSACLLVVRREQGRVLAVRVVQVRHCGRMGPR